MFFLILHVLSYHFFIYTYGIDTITSCPKTIPPLLVLTQAGKFTEQSKGCFTLYVACYMGNRKPWRHFYPQMDMVCLVIQLHYFYPGLLT
ncbi:hypothetical protein SY86_06130 [Erwinia tracheiphila]|uniref:Uncharacterized protein n=1 Tax=Erwinia tracheiphila TaxID=65700 RepID=A0A0M2KCX5_9GAMM|nr:hypothetical protein ETR_03184 [Erwinia tracheiphila PSU-1]KKF35098.1 hypothetical protein SY86_06130 [Erwinia tracheiphila]